MPISESTREQMQLLAARYPQPRSALLPMLHLVQSLDGEVTVDGIHALSLIHISFIPTSRSSSTHRWWSG